MQLGLRFPDRAEDLPRFADYRVFLQHWATLIAILRSNFRQLHFRGASSVLGIHGPQGAGKSLFARHLEREVAANTPALARFSTESLWHQVLADTEPTFAAVSQTASATKVFRVDSRTAGRDWLAEPEAWVSSHPSHRALLMVDEADQAFFIKALVELSDAEFALHGALSSTIQMAAHRFVKRLRETMHGTMCLLFTNNETFLQMFQAAMDAQHTGMMTSQRLPQPSPAEKEQIVRVNTNRLNPFSYWHCLSNATPESRRDAYLQMRTAETFPAAFKSIDAAVSSASRRRAGRPSRKGVLNFVVLCAASDVSGLVIDGLGNVERDEFLHALCRIRVHDSGWANGLVETSERAQMLASEWNLRLVLLADPWAGCLLRTDVRCKTFLEAALTYRGPGTSDATRIDDARVLGQLCDEAAALADSTATAAFWRAGQARSSQYEPVLSTWFPGYNTRSGSGTRARPDLELAHYQVCSILASSSEEDADLRSAIQRDANVVEFTSQQTPTVPNMRTYLASKLGNYVTMLLQ